jgi:hypothetical protein
VETARCEVSGVQSVTNIPRKEGDRKKKMYFPFLGKPPLLFSNRSQTWAVCSALTVTAEYKVLMDMCRPYTGIKTENNFIFHCTYLGMETFPVSIPVSGRRIPIKPYTPQLTVRAQQTVQDWLRWVQDKGHVPEKESKFSSLSPLCFES